MSILGIDVGTGGTRAVLIDLRGRVISAATAEHAPMSSPHIGWAEQSPDDWWRAACQAIKECFAKSGTTPQEVSAIGLTGQMHGLVLLDAQDKVVRPALLWCDQRTGEECREITEQVGAQRLIELTANPALTGFTLPKIWWVRKHEPELWSRVRSLMLPKDYIRLRLTGARAIDVADASGTLMFDVVHRRWSKAMLEISRIDEGLLPKVFESPEISGHVHEQGARLAGLKAGIPVVAGAGDQAAGAVGMGIVKPGAVSATIGTSGVVFAATSAPVLEPKGRIHTFCHAIPNRWHVMGVTQGAGLSLRWFRDQFGAGKDDGRDPYERLAEEAAKTPPGADGLLWAPYLMGERTPHLDPNARGALVGITAQHTRAHVIRAILEGVAFSLRDTVTLFREIGVPIESIRLSGGGARSALWQQIQADIYGMPVELIEADEGAAYGAALLAAVGTGNWTTVEAACETAVRVAKRVQPDAKTARLMDLQYVEYRKLYPALKVIQHNFN
ncbi:MAG TPA: xylulokinase [Candidatus Acidoferrales bacterium]|jgi:xylulokinase|nr:xylulokinase [Candidatus Acidoferrales bacterium]